jgi:hypothetical protein
MIGSFAVQTAIRSVLVTASITGGRIVDAPITKPQASDFPYVEIGDSQALDDTLSTREGSDEYLTLHVWSRYRGQKEAKDIMAAIKVALDGAILTATGRTSAHAWVREGRIFADPDGLTQHGIVTVRIQHFS